MDDLEEQLALAAHPSAAIDVMNEAAYHARYTNPAFMEAVAERALNAAKEQQYERGLADARRNKGLARAVYNDAGSALHYLRQALEFYEQAAIDDRRIQTVGNIAAVHQLQQHYDLALDWHNHSCKLAEEHDLPAVRANALYNIGLIERQLEDFDEALSHLQDAYAIYHALADHRGTALSLNAIGEVHIRLGNAQAGFDFLERAIAYSIEQDLGFLTGQPRVNLAEFYIDEGQLDAANEQLRLATDGFEQQNDFSGLAHAYMMQAKLFLKQNRLEGARDRAEKTLKLARDKSLDELALKALELLAKIYAGQGDYQQAYQTQEKFATLYGKMMRNNARQAVNSVHSHYRNQQNNTSERSVAASKPAPPELSKEQEPLNNPTNTLENQLATDLLNATWNLRLPTVEQLRRRFPESFVYHLPLAGPCTDFYIQAEREDALYLAVANVPHTGLTSSLFTQLAYEYLATYMHHPSYAQPAEILNAFQESIRPALDHPQWEYPPELRLAVVRVDEENLTITFSGAGLSIYWWGGGGLEELPMGNRPIRGGDTNLKFLDNELNGQKGHQLYLSTDGYQQLAEKVGLPPLLQQLKELHGYDFSLKAPVLKSIMEKVMKNHSLPDDILILGAGL